jgi:putative membrane protein
MRHTVRSGRVVVATMCAVVGAVVGVARGAGSADAGTDGGSGILRDIGQGAGTAAGNVSSGVESAAQGVAGGAKDAAAGARQGFSKSKDGGTAETPVSGAGGQLTDARIAAIAVTANKVDIEAGRLAMRKSKSVAVKNFASEMISDHTSANKQAVALAKKLGVSPEQNDFSRSLEQGGRENLASLKTLAGREFDRAYAEHEVAYHQEVLGALKDKLIPSAQNAELKSLLQSVQALVKEHLDHAESLYESLSK